MDFRLDIRSKKLFHLQTMSESLVTEYEKIKETSESDTTRI